MDDLQSSDNQPSQALQFRLSTIFVLTLVATVLAAYLSPLGSDLLLAGLTSTVTSFLVALVIGSVRPPLADRVFWAIVIAAMMQAVCADIPKLDRLEIFAWPITAGIAAAIAAGRGNLYLRMIMAALAAAVTFAAFATRIDAATIDLALNAFCAAIGGALLAVLISFISWTAARYKLPQPAIGLVMVVSAIGFAIIAPQVVPGW